MMVLPIVAAALISGGAGLVQQYMKNKGQGGPPGGGLGGAGGGFQMNPTTGIASNMRQANSPGEENFGLNLQAPTQAPTPTGFNLGMDNMFQQPTVGGPALQPTNPDPGFGAGLGIAGGTVNQAPINPETNTNPGASMTGAGYAQMATGLGSAAYEMMNNRGKPPAGAGLGGRPFSMGPSMRLGDLFRR